MLYKRASKSKRKQNRKPKRAPASASLKRAIESVLKKRVETKFNINQATESTVNTVLSPVTGNSLVLNALTTGASIQNRLGCKVNGKFVNVRGSIINPEDTPVYVRIVLLHACENDLPTEDLLETNASTFGPAGEDLSTIYARANTSKYQILKNKVLKLGNTGGLQQTQLFNMTVNLKNTMYQYENVAGITTPTNKKLILIYYARRADNDETTGINLEMSWNSKFYFTDM